MSHPRGAPQIPTWFLGFKRFRKAQRSRVPLRLPMRTPACFDSAAKWKQYHTLATISAEAGFTFCKDCTPEYKARMVKAGRCAFPGTQFVLLHSGTEDKEVVGRRAK